MNANGNFALLHDALAIGLLVSWIAATVLNHTDIV
jgi:hypothetical protein